MSPYLCYFLSMYLKSDKNMSVKLISGRFDTGDFFLEKDSSIPFMSAYR